jgi:hypothetical protein
MRQEMAVIATAPSPLSSTSVSREPVQRKRLPISRAGLSTSAVETISWTKERRKRS